MIKKTYLLLFVSLWLPMLAACPEAPMPTAGCNLARGSNSGSEKKSSLVFVPSGFGEDWSGFRDEVEKALSAFSAYTPFEGVNDSNSPHLNVYFVAKKAEQNTFCNFNCLGIDRLLCCDVPTAKALSAECVQGPRQTVVIHRDDKYGGAGYLGEDLATISTHSAAPHVAVHELAHSFFDLADEYDYGTGTSQNLNCQSSTCDNWADLLNAGFSDIGCEAGYCHQGGYFASGLTIMSKLGAPFLSANERFACCAYLNDSGSWPPFCDKFNTGALSLKTYCDKHASVFSKKPASNEGPIWIEIEKNMKGAWKLLPTRALNRERWVRRQHLESEAVAGDISVEVVSKTFRKTFFLSNSQQVEVPGVDQKIERILLPDHRTFISFVIEDAKQAKGATVFVNRSAIGQIQ